MHDLSKIHSLSSLIIPMSFISFHYVLCRLVYSVRIGVKWWVLHDRPNLTKHSWRWCHSNRLFMKINAKICVLQTCTNKSQHCTVNLSRSADKHQCYYYYYYYILISFFQIFILHIIITIMSRTARKQYKHTYALAPPKSIYFIS